MLLSDYNHFLLYFRINYKIDMIKRTIGNYIEKRFFKGKAILIFGPRQAGKSTMIKNMLEEKGLSYLSLNGDEADIRETLFNTTSAKLKLLTGNNKIVFIDEAQRIANIGLTLKLFTDHLKNIQVIASGSSSFDLASQVNEPLTGRKYEFMLYPLSFGEMVQEHGLLQEKRLLEQRMIYGSYPEIVTDPEEALTHLKLLANSYLYKDLLLLDQINKPVLLQKILKALALQLGNEVKFTEIGNMVGADKITVEKYIDLLEKAFVIFNVPALSRNVRNEISKGKKIYFYDCGVRNAIINNFNNLSSRTDTGALWENYFIAERRKFLNNNNITFQHYFWRTTQQQEIDFIEETEAGLKAFECKWSDKAKIKFSQTFIANYAGTELNRVNPKNVEEFLI